MFKTIIFDCDGVLINSEIIANRVEVDVKTELGFPITLEEQLRKFVGLGTSHPAVQADLKHLPPHYQNLVDVRVKAAYEKELKAIDGVIETLEKLKVPMCVASSSPGDWLIYKLELTKLKHHFGDAIFNGQMVEHCKPAPDLFLLALDRMKWRPETTLVIEDSAAGVAAAKAAGLTVWGFLGGEHISAGHAERLKTLGADHVFSNFLDVLAVMDA